MFKAANFKNNTMGIGEGVMMCALDRNALCRSGDGLVALAAENVFLLLGRWFLGFFRDQFRCVLSALFAGLLAK
jgi:hypothetical protein